MGEVSLSDIERLLSEERARLRGRIRIHEDVVARTHVVRKRSPYMHQDINVLIDRCNDALADIRWSERRVSELESELEWLQGLDDPNLEP